MEAADTRSPDAADALATLCESYWYPVYGIVRSLEGDAERARDLTQGFFVHLLETRAIKAADPARGRFRSFLTAAVRNYLANLRRGERAHKRGGGTRRVALDFRTAERRYIAEPMTEESPEAAFDRRWARAAMADALEHLRGEMEPAQPERFRLLEPCLTGRSVEARYRDIAGELGMTEDAVKAAVRRMRKRFGALLREKVADTVRDPAHVDDELRYLLRILAA